MVLLSGTRSFDRLFVGLGVGRGARVGREEGRGLFEDGGERGRRRRGGDSEWWLLVLLLPFSLLRTLFFFSFAGFTPCRMRKRKRKKKSPVMMKRI